MGEIIREALADRGFVRLSVTCLMVFAVSTWVQDQSHFVGLGSDWPPLTVLRDLTGIVVLVVYVLGGLGLGMISAVVGAWFFRAPSQIMSPREYVRRGLSVFTFILGFVIIFSVLGLMMDIVDSSGLASNVTILTGLETLSYVGWSRWVAGPRHCQCGDQVEDD